MFVLFPGSVWNSDCLEGGVTNFSPGREAESLIGHPLSFLRGRRPLKQTNQFKLKKALNAGSKMYSNKNEILFYEWYSSIWRRPNFFYQMEWVWQWLRLQFGSIGRLRSEEEEEARREKPDWKWSAKGDFHYYNVEVHSGFLRVGN